MDPVVDPAAPPADPPAAPAAAAPVTPPVPDTAAADALAAAATPPAEHYGQRPSATFSVNGQPTADHAAVQAHIAALEEFRTKSVAAGREAAVRGWAKDGKIAEPQVASLIAVSLAMDETSFAAFSSSYDAAPKLSLLDNHGGDHEHGAPATESDEFDLLVETLKNHKRARLGAEQIKATKTYAKFAAICATRGERPETHIDL